MKDETFKDFQSKSLSYHDLSDPAKKLYLNLLKENYETLALKGIKLDYFKFIELTNLHFNSLRLACEFIIQKLDGQGINGKHLDDLLNNSGLLPEDQIQHSFSGYDPYDNSTSVYNFVKKSGIKKEFISYEGLKEGMTPGQQRRAKALGKIRH